MSSVRKGEVDVLAVLPPLTFFCSAFVSAFSFLGRSLTCMRRFAVLVFLVIAMLLILRAFRPSYSQGIKFVLSARALIRIFIAGGSRPSYWYLCARTCISPAQSFF